MSNLESWLDDKTNEVRKREEAGFPEDVDAEIRWNKVSLYHENLMLFENPKTFVCLQKQERVKKVIV